MPSAVSIKVKAVNIEGVQLEVPYIDEGVQLKPPYLRPLPIPPSRMEVTTEAARTPPAPTSYNGDEVPPLIGEKEFDKILPSSRRKKKSSNKKKTEPEEPTFANNTALDDFLRKQQREFDNENDQDLRAKIENDIKATEELIKRKKEFCNQSGSLLTFLKRTEDKQAIEFFQNEINEFIQNTENDLFAARQALIIDTRMKFYNQLKEIILSPLWDEEVKMCGGESILNKDGQEVNVPTGIESMMRTVANKERPKKSCHEFMFFCQKNRVSREQASQEEKLAPDQCVKKIKAFRNAAEKRALKHKKEYQKSEKQTKPVKKTEQFYRALCAIKDNELYDVTALKMYIEKMKSIHPTDSTSRLVCK